jgi:cytochrome c
MAQEANPAPESGQTNPVKPTEKSQTRAKKMFEIDCAMCHGAIGDGKTDLAKGMGLTLGDWTNPNTMAGKQDRELFKVIRSGKSKMPPEDVARANDDEVWNLIHYIRGLSKQQPAAAPK